MNFVTKRLISKAYATGKCRERARVKEKALDLMRFDFTDEGTEGEPYLEKSKNGMFVRYADVLKMLER